MSKYRVGIVGCGAILPRHIESIENNKDFELLSLCDIQEDLVKEISKKYKTKYFTDYKKMIKESEINFVTISTPNSLHYEESIFALENGCDVLIEKPVAFSTKEVFDIMKVAKKNNRKAYCVLQVRLNPTVSFLKEILSEGILGDIRSVNFIQRWQRPIEYFTGLRAIPTIGGGTLYELGIHYLDILQYVFRLVKENSSLYVHIYSNC
jgi:predicted dehydrogenase